MDHDIIETVNSVFSIVTMRRVAILLFDLAILIGCSKILIVKTLHVFFLFKYYSSFINQAL